MIGSKNSPVKKIEASGLSIMTNSVDIANARIHFENGSVANITSSRVAKDRVRKIKIFQRNLYITIDFLIGLTEIYRVMDKEKKGTSAIITAPLDSKGKPRQIVYEKPKIKKQDALQMELINFIEAIQGKSKTIVDGVATSLAIGTLNLSASLDGISSTASVTIIPADRIASILSEAPPLPPATIAPA